MKKEMINFWKPDKITFDKIQKLKEFVDFIYNLKFSTEKDKKKAQEIMFLIENIDKPETHKNWNICLDIFDRDIQDGMNTKGGFYWRKWSVYFELNYLEIEAESNHTSDDSGHYGNDFFYGASVHFNKTNDVQQAYMDTDINEFINDAKNYKKYITKTLNDIEIDIDVWEKKQIE